MNARIRLTVIGSGIAFLLALTIWLVAGAPGSQSTQTAVTSEFDGALRPPDMPIQQLDGLHDQDGKPAKLTDDVTIVTFLYTNCEDTCPTTAQQIRGALDRLKDPPPAIAISVDPAGDNERNARGFLANQTLTGRMSYLLGKPVALQRQWQIYGIQPQLKDSEHTASVVLLDRTGRQRVGFPADKLTPEALAADVERLRAEPS
jgi:protein SCO1/2